MSDKQEETKLIPSVALFVKIMFSKDGELINLLTDNCSFFSKPELRIFADDVKCSHGSTIGPLDESALYYLRSRGISKNEAMKMIISSFIEEDLQNLDKNIAEQITNNLSNYLKSIENDWKYKKEIPSFYKKS